MKRIENPTAFSKKVQRYLVEYIKENDLIPDFDESNLVYCFLHREGMNAQNDYCSILYYKYSIDPNDPTRYQTFDVGNYIPQNQLTGELYIFRGGYQASYCIDKKENM